VTAATATVRIVLPAHLRRLAGSGSETRVEVSEPVTLESVLGALESAYPVLVGTIRDRRTGQRRAFIRFFACELDLSNDRADERLPPPVVAGSEPLLVVGAMAGG